MRWVSVLTPAVLLAWCSGYAAAFAPAVRPQISSTSRISATEGPKVTLLQSTEGAVAEIRSIEEINAILVGQESPNWPFKTTLSLNAQERMMQKLSGELTEEEYTARGQVEMLESRAVVVQITATWCRACTFMLQKLGKLAPQYPDVICVQFQAETLPPLLGDIGAKSLPAFVLFHRGKQLELQYIKETARLAAMLDRATELSNSSNR